MVKVMNWRKSSYSGDNSGNCVEVADKGNQVLVRDTKDLTGPMLWIAPDAWRMFTGYLKSLAKK